MMHYTTKEHYIPRTYLECFSVNELNIDDKHKMVYQYDLKQSYQMIAPIQVNCAHAFEKNIYELMDEKGEIVLRNRIENCLAFLESKYKKNLCILRNKINNKTKLSNNQVNYFLTFMLIQLIRTPYFMSSAVDVLKEYAEYDGKENMLKNYVLQMGLPFFENTESAMIFDHFCKILADMKYTFCISRGKKFLTSDNPVCVLQNIEGAVIQIVYPLSNDLCIIGSNDDGDDYLEMDDEDVFDVNCKVINNADRFFYSGFRISKREMKRIDYEIEHIFGGINAKTHITK